MSDAIGCIEMMLSFNYIKHQSWVNQQMVTLALGGHRGKAILATKRDCVSNTSGARATSCSRYRCRVLSHMYLCYILGFT